MTKYQEICDCACLVLSGDLVMLVHVCVWSCALLSTHYSTHCPAPSTTPLPDVAIPEKVVQLERERSVKWGNMIRNWDRFVNSSTLHRRVNKGVCVCVCVICSCMY